MKKKTLFMRINYPYLRRRHGNKLIPVGIGKKRYATVTTVVPLSFLFKMLYNLFFIVVNVVFGSRSSSRCSRCSSACCCYDDAIIVVIIIITIVMAITTADIALMFVHCKQ